MKVAKLNITGKSRKEEMGKKVLRSKYQHPFSMWYRKQNI